MNEKKKNKINCVWIEVMVTEECISEKINKIKMEKKMRRRKEEERTERVRPISK